MKKSTVSRRDFIKLGTGVAATGLAAKATILEPLYLAAAPRPVPPSNKLGRIAVTTWSLHAFFPRTRERTASNPGELDVQAQAETLDLRKFPELIADRYHVHNLELCSSHFESTEASYLSDLKENLRKAHARVINMPVDYPHDWDGRGLSDPDDKQWRWEIAERKKWIDVAAELGAQSIRPNPGGTEKMTDLSRPIAAYKELGEYGKSKGVKVLIENHGNAAAQAENVVAIIKGAGPQRVGALPDFGNFPEEARYHGLELLFPYASIVCHARYETIGHGEMKGKVITYDFARCMKISQAAGFKGIYSAEVEGLGDPYVLVQKDIDELVKYL